jgi:hypothetical protein
MFDILKCHRLFEDRWDETGEIANNSALDAYIKEHGGWWRENEGDTGIEIFFEGENPHDINCYIHLDNIRY